MKKKTYEEAVAELEKLVSELENSQLSLDELTDKYAKAVKLAGYCSECLEKAKLKIEKASEPTVGEEQSDE